MSQPWVIFTNGRLLGSYKAACHIDEFSWVRSIAGWVIWPCEWNDPNLLGMAISCGDRGEQIKVVIWNTP